MGEPVKIPILGVGRFAGLNREYSVEYSIGSGRLGCGAAYGSARQGNILGNIIRLGWRLGLRLGAARLNRLKYGARVSQSSSTSGRVAATGLQSPDLKSARVDHPGVRLR